MKKVALFLAIASVLINCQATDVICPTGRQPMDFYTGAFSIADFPNPIKLQPGVDILCMNYTLPTPFSSNPNIAVGIIQFESQRSPDLFGSVKPLMSANPNTNQIPFQIRTQWKYTIWVKITVNFLAETRTDMEASYYQQDTGVVSGCGDTKAQALLLPLRGRFDIAKPLGVRVFLNGFEISTQPTTQNINTPYEIQLFNPKITPQGILVYLSTTTATQVYTVHISSFVYMIDPNSPIQISSGVFDRMNIADGKTQQLVLDTQQLNPNYLMYGLSGFIINQNYVPKLSLKIELNLGVTIAVPGILLVYLRVEYAIFAYSQCSSCSGYPYLYMGQCYAACPPGTVTSGKGCVQCPPNSSPSSSIGCACNQGFYNISGVCTGCPPNSFFNGNQCINCGLNAELFMGNCRCISGFYNISGACTSCQAGTQWNGVSCVSNCAQQPGTYWNGTQCVCLQAGAVWNGQTCAIPYVPPPPPPPTPTPTPPPTQQCGSGAVAYWNGQSCQCFQNGLYWNGVDCVPSVPNPQSCDSTAYWNGNQCICKQPGQYWNGQTCINFVVPGSPPGNVPTNPTVPPTLPPTGPPTAPPQSPFQCPVNSYWNGNFCACTIPGQFWNGISCLPNTSPPSQCPADSYWNGASCVCFKPGQYWTGLSCSPLPIQCPSTSYWNGNTCICLDMNNYWNGSACVSGVMPTLCPYQSYWNGKICICLDGQSYWNGTVCVRGNINQCHQQNTYWNGMGCVCCPGFLNVSGVCVYNTNSNCSVIANSFWNGYQCECSKGYRWAFGYCLPNSLYDGGRPNDNHRPNGRPGDNDGRPGNNNYPPGFVPGGSLPGNFMPFPPSYPPPNSPSYPQSSCSDGMYFDQPAQKCLPCTEGCGRCTNCTVCLACSRGYFLNPKGLCSEVCGDGLRFTLQCDDGNLIDGDGCSSTCDVESGWTCGGGSPNSRDTCTNVRPTRVMMVQTGQSLAQGKVTINLRLNWLPGEMIQKSCKECNNLFQIQITKGNPAASITTSYVPGTSFSFSVVFDYMNKSPVTDFCASIRINPDFQRTYFLGLDISQIINVRIDPAMFSQKDQQTLAL